MTFNEDLPNGTFPTSPTLDYSPTGVFTDEVTKHIDSIGYTVTIANSKQLVIELKPGTVAASDIKNPGRFRIVSLNGTDYANLPLDLNGGIFISVP
ncbi:hypothetical protein [Paenibacillus macerans]|uniref:hypothetical protein n=1 Tax=Paenibacillus macerans TaxID=44252 RepID=UPI003D322BE3